MSSSSPNSCQRPPIIVILFKEYFFVLTLFAALVAGILFPEPAARLADYRSALLFFVMFLVGLEQKLPALAQQFRKVSALVLSLMMSFALFPVISWAIGTLFFGAGELVAGFVVLGAVPTTLTSAVIYTRLDRGNDRLALVIVLLSQILCVIVTPALIEFFMNVMPGVGVGLKPTPTLDVGKMMFQLVLYFLAPLGLGMFFAQFLSLDKIKRFLTRPEQLVVALFVFMGAGHIPAATPWGLVGKTLLAVMLIQMGYVILVRFVIRSYPSADQTALFFTTTQKTMSVGLYLLLSYFPSAAVLPMVFYHLTQLSIGRLYWLPAHRHRS